MPSATLRELADLVGGQVVGDGQIVIQNALPPKDAKDPGCLTLADSAEMAKVAQQSLASAIVAKQQFDGCEKPMLVVADTHRAFSRIIAHLRPERVVEPASPNTSAGSITISDRANVDYSAQLGKGTVIAPGVSVGPGCRIGKRCVIHPNVTLMQGCQIGDDCLIFPGCVLYPGTVLGDRVLLHASSVIGAYGFGYRQVDGCHRRTSQLGWVEIESDVEIGAGTTIDRGTYGPTRIGQGTKTDNQVQIGHNCQIGKHNLICAQVGIAGSCSTGDYVVMGGQAGLADHLHIGDRAMLGAQSGHMRDVPPDQVVLGTPAAPRKQKLQEWFLAPKLPEMRQEMRQLIQRVTELESMIASGGAVPAIEISQVTYKQNAA